MHTELRSLQHGFSKKRRQDSGQQGVARVTSAWRSGDKAPNDNALPVRFSYPGFYDFLLYCTLSNAVALFARRDELTARTVAPRKA